MLYNSKRKGGKKMIHKQEISVSTVVQINQPGADLKTFIVGAVWKYDSYTEYTGIDENQKPFTLTVYATKRN